MNIGEITGREFDIIISALEEHSFNIQDAIAAKEVTKLELKLLKTVGDSDEYKS